MSANSSPLPRHESLNSATHVAGDTLELAKLPRKRSDMSASSFGELLTCAVTVPVTLFSRVAEPLVYRSVTVSVTITSAGVTASAPGVQPTIAPLPLKVPVGADHT